MKSKDGVARCVVIGAGMAGLTAAGILRRHGLEVTVLDKARGVGGRMATRRFEGGIFDHGAQFITVRDDRLRRMMDGWVAGGVAREWCRGFPKPGAAVANDGHLRFCGTAGMTAIAKSLAAGLDVGTGSQVTRVREAGGAWVVELENARTVAGAALLLTPPIPQSLALLDAGGVGLPDRLRGRLEGVAYEPCFAVMAVLDGPSKVPSPGGVQLEDGPISWIADNTQKGISPAATAITIHASAEFSRAHFESDTDDVGRALLEAAGSWIGAPVRAFQVHRWRYSMPVEVIAEPCLDVSSPAPLVVAGDAFGGPRVEGAALSGMAAAERILELLERN